MVGALPRLFYMAAYHTKKAGNTQKELVWRLIFSDLEGWIGVVSEMPWISPCQSL
jgi:hypothetical protein